MRLCVSVFNKKMKQKQKKIHIERELLKQRYFYYTKQQKVNII